jgi:hypothetical protein
MVILGPTFPTFWCHDSGQVSPLVLVGTPILTHPMTTLRM